MQVESCGGHKGYPSRAAAVAMNGWHPRCPKCRSGLVMGVWLCRPEGKHWHRGHREPTEAERRLQAAFA